MIAFTLSVAEHLVLALAMLGSRTVSLSVRGIVAGSTWLRSVLPRARTSSPKATSMVFPEAAAPVGDEAILSTVPSEQITFEDVAGLENVKRILRTHVLLPYLRPGLADALGLRSGRGVLLFGLPGVGKSYLLRAMAGELGPDVATFVLSPRNVLSRWEGAESRVADIIRRARACGRAAICIDEAESLFTRRSFSGSVIGRRVLSVLLSELEGVESNSSLILLATSNEPWQLDPAALRPGRFDSLVYVPLPDEPARREILRLNLAARRCAADIELDELAAGSDGYSGADLREICERAAGFAFERCLGTPDAAPEIRQQDLLHALAAVSPSVTEAERARFERYAAEHSLVPDDRVAMLQPLADRSSARTALWSCENGHSGTGRPLLRIRNSELHLICTDPTCGAEVEWQHAGSAIG